MDFMYAGEIIRGNIRIPTNIQVTAQGIITGSISKTIYNWESIADLEIAGPDSRTSRVTATRLVALGILALGAKKDTSRTLVILSLRSGETVTVVFVRKSEPEVRAIFASHMHRWQAQIQVLPDSNVSTDRSAQDDINSRVDRLTSLADLLARGMISESEFEVLKAGLLSSTEHSLIHAEPEIVQNGTELVDVSVRPSDGVWDTLTSNNAHFLRLYRALYWLGHFDLYDHAGLNGVDAFLASRSVLEIPYKLPVINAHGIARSAVGSKYEVVIHPSLPPHLMGSNLEPLDVMDGTPLTFHMLDFSKVHFGIAEVDWNHVEETIDILDPLERTFRDSGTGSIEKLAKKDRKLLRDGLSRVPHGGSEWTLPAKEYVLIRDKLKRVNCRTHIGICDRVATKADQIFYNGALLNEPV